MRKWVADLETTTDLRLEYDGTTYAWAVGLCEVGNPTNTIIYKRMSDFIDWCKGNKTNDMVYFHNIRFDGNFLIQWLLNNGYEHITDEKDKRDKTFTTLISAKGLWYEIEVFFSIKKKKVNKITFRDSMKLIPLSVEQIAKEFHLPIQKGSIDYSAHDFLPEGSDLTKEEEDYLIKDVQIVEHALRFFFEQGLDRMTIGACALSDYKHMIGVRNFERYFPTPFYDEWVRASYRGGMSYLNPRFANKDIKKPMVILDRNSMFPSVMAGCNGEILPYGTPIFYKGEYKHDDLYCLYVQRFRCSFRIKPNKIPTVYMTGDYYFQGGDSAYLTSSDGEELVLTMTSVDFKLFMEQYDVYNLVFIDGWKFKGIKAEKLFGEYVRKWTAIKVKSKEEGNWGMYLIAKLFLNSLYGKFGSATTMQNREPYIGEDGKMHFKLGKVKEKDGIYIAMASFITAYARADLVGKAQKIEDDYKAKKSKIQFVYMDTDSLHCVSPDFKIPDGIEIDKTKLGAWDHEASAVRSKFIRQKCYMEKHIIDKNDYEKAMADDSTIKAQYEDDGNGNYYFNKITVAGMPSSCYEHVSFEKFKIGASFPGKLAHRTAIGGVVLESIDFTIKS